MAEERYSNAVGQSAAGHVCARESVLTEIYVRQHDGGASCQLLVLKHRSSSIQILLRIHVVVRLYSTQWLVRTASLLKISRVATDVIRQVRVRGGCRAWAIKCDLAVCCGSVPLSLTAPSRSSDERTPQYKLRNPTTFPLSSLLLSNKSKLNRANFRRASYQARQRTEFKDD